MNISGSPTYNREVGAMRNAGTNVDTMKRLIFIFPFGIDNSIANIPFQTIAKGDMDNIQDALRAFFSVSVLKEIFASNALNLVTIASTYQRMTQQKNRSTTLINSLIRGGSNYGSYSSLSDEYGRDPLDSIPQLDSSVIQSKLNEKFKRIKDSLRTDPRLKKMLPFMEVITLNNLLDVPVITGTAPFQLDTGALFSFLAAAIIQRRKISSWSEIRSIISQLRTMPDSSVYDIYRVLSNVESSFDTPPSAIPGHNLTPPPTNSGEELQRLTAAFGREQNENRKRKLKLKIDAAQNQYALHNIALLKDDKLKELERNFLFMTSPDQLLARYGLSSSISQASYAATKVSSQTELLFDRTKQQMLDFFSGADPIFSSTYNLLSPMVTTDSSYNRPPNANQPNAPTRVNYIAWGTNYLAMKSDLVNTFADSYDTFMDSFKRYFDTTIREDIEMVSMKISELNKSCDGVREDFVALMNFFNSTLSGRNGQIYPTFSLEDVMNFSDALDKVFSKFSAVGKTSYEALTKFFGNDNMKKIEIAINNIISNSFDSFFTKFNATSDPTSPLQAKIFALDTPDPNSASPMALARKKSMHFQFLSQVSEVAKTVMQTVFLLIFRINLCEFVQVADVEFSAAKADVLDLPNYCLVLPVEVVQALMVIYTKRNLTQAVLSSGGGFNPLNSSNIKGLVKTLRTQLDIPNLMVFDRKKGELYYAFRYLGTTAEKLKMQAVETFVKHHIQDNSSGLSQVYY